MRGNIPHRDRIVPSRRKVQLRGVSHRVQVILVEEAKLHEAAVQVLRVMIEPYGAGESV